MYNFITIEGNIGAGKTSLCHKLSLDLNAQLILEQFEENPFISKFYEDKDKNALPLELTLMSERYQQLKNLTNTQNLFHQYTISDYLFIKSKLYAYINLKEDEWWLYQKIFELLYAKLPEPDILIYLHASVARLEENIQKRGREYEKDMDRNYLKKIETAYFELFRNKPHWTILIIDTSKVDFVNNFLQ